MDAATDTKAYLEKIKRSKLSPKEREADASQRMASQQLRLNAYNESVYEALIERHGVDFCIALGKYAATQGRIAKTLSSCSS
jgi:hypothetical protein